MTTSASSVFHYLRGAIRGDSGVEDFRGKSILVIGMDTIGQDLLARLCFDGVNLFFLDNSLVNYNQAHVICGSVNLFEDQTDVDIVINLDEGFISYAGKHVPISEIGEDPYTQGIHEFYL